MNGLNVVFVDVGGLLAAKSAQPFVQVDTREPFVR